MYPKFVELHHEDGSAFTININKIKLIENGYVGGYCVQESYEDVKTLIEETGCLIHKGDPRLTTKPLTIADMRDLVGEPIWNSNINKWFLVAQYDEQGQTAKIESLHGVSFWVDDEALLKFPHYRMKKEVSHD